MARAKSKSKKKRTEQRGERVLRPKAKASAASNSRRKAALPKTTARRKAKSSGKRRALDTTLESALVVTPRTRLEALQAKLAGLEKIEAELRSHLTHTEDDEIELRPSIRSIQNAKATVQGQIAAATVSVLPPPSQADVRALADAVRDAETVIAQNQRVNDLIRAANVLIAALQQ
jgi:hypothetical protein